ncbi:MAG: hypothetical protein EZS28_036001 [Streblomastix strix]|uniref:Uncharacterized protein n=1 Tax=Streblomastix strix TaxID=222440 RepID=A0A5J4UEZ7_9EUKA|nr:MAG: hypothetical protein EZS28_036001 [Streblomastix strix]
MEEGGALDAGAILAGVVDRLKRYGSSGGMISNEEYQLFIDNSNALVYAESGTVWMYEQNWYNSGDIIPDQVAPANDATPLSDGTETVDICTEFSRQDHVHLLNITTSVSPSDSASESVGTTNYFARNNNSQLLNIIASISPKDDNSGSVGTTYYYARNDHSHQINVQTSNSKIQLVNGVGANGTSAFYARNDQVHPQQLIQYGNVTANNFIKASGTNQQMLIADGTNKKIIDFNTSSIQKAFQIGPSTSICWECFAVLTIPNYTSYGSYGCIIDISTAYIYDLFIQPKLNLGIQNGFTREFKATQFGSRQTDFMVIKGLLISADGKTLTFNGSVIAGTGATNGATNGTVQNSAGNPILWNVNSVGTQSEFYRNGAKVYWSAHPITLGSVLS